MRSRCQVAVLPPKENCKALGFPRDDKEGRWLHLELSDWMERVKRRSTRARVKAVRGCTTRPPRHIVFTLFGRPVEKVLDRGFYHQ
jgi:hypothetical protein